MANPMAVRAIASAKAKTDRLDARTLAKLLAAGFLPAVWLGDERTRLLRRLVSRHAQLIRQRTRANNQIHAVLQRTLKGRLPRATCSVSEAAPGSMTRTSLPTSARPCRPASATSSS
jgi:transposase